MTTPIDTDNNPLHNLLKPNAQAPMLNRRRFLQASSMTAAAGASLVLAGCNDDDNDIKIEAVGSSNANTRVQFLHGVASGDPLSDRVIIWTRVTPDSAGSYPVQWQVATDKNFDQIVQSGTTQANGGADYTVKVDVTGLKPATTYYYRFMAGSATSTTGTTKTLPTGDVTQVKFAVISCSNFPAGYFHAYADIARQPVDAVIHLGDYIYEYGRTTTNSNGQTVTAYASAHAAELGREVKPATELLAINDYRERYAQYRSDKDLQAMHAALPMIAVWDDHEIANDAYTNGAENHQPNEGDWNTRKMAAMKAYHEWMPTRNGVMNQIYRSFNFGNLVSLHMLDTRIIGRDKQLDYNDYIGADANGQPVFDGNKFVTDWTNANRQLLGLAQQNWLYSQMQQSNATWQILGQQVVMGKMRMPSPVLFNLLNPKVGVSISDYLAMAQKAQQAPATLSAQEQAILNAPYIPYNLDAWDGYAVVQETVFAMAKNLNKNLVVLSGDTHNAWANNLVTNDGKPAGVEFAVQSVTSPGFEAYLHNIPPAQLAAVLPMLVQNATLKWCDTSRRGYMVVTATREQCQCDWVFVSDILQPSYSANVGKTMTVKAGQMQLIG